MTKSSRPNFFIRIGIAAAVVLASSFLLLSCNDTGVSPYAPAIVYKRLVLSAVVNQVITPDSILSTGGAVDDYSIDPALPSGLILNSRTGMISGTPTSADSSVNYTVTATGPSGNASAMFTLCVSDATHLCKIGTGAHVPVITLKAIAGVKGSAIIPDTVVSTGGAINSFSVTPALPAGLTFNSRTGIISGTSTAVDSSKSYTMKATGPSGSATVVFIVCVGLTPSSCNINPPDISYSPYMAADGADGPGYMWTSPAVAFAPDTPFSSAGIIARYTISPPLPAGVTMDSITGIISGKPTATQPAKEYNVAAIGPYGTDTALVYIGVYASGYPFALFKRGIDRYKGGSCYDCHGSTGDGSRCPKVHHSDYLMANNHRVIRIQMLGLPNFVDTNTTIVIAPGDTWSSSMPQVGGSDSTISGVLTFIRAFFNGATDYISVQEVSQLRDSLSHAISVDTNLKYITLDPHADQQP